MSRDLAEDGALNERMSRRHFVSGAAAAVVLGAGATAALAAEGVPPDVPSEGMGPGSNGSMEGDPGQGGQGGDMGGDPGQGGQGGGDMGPAGEGGGQGGDMGGQGGMGGEGGGMGGPNTMTFDYTGSYNGAYTVDGITDSSFGEWIDAPEVDQNAVLVRNGGTVAIEQAQITKAGSDNNGDNCNFYGVNSIVLVLNEGSMLYLSDSTLEASGTGSNGVFATDSGTAYVKDCTIATQQDNSRGLDATYGGNIYAHHLDINTQRDHCAAIANDRGGGYISVTDSTLATAGSGSPLLYSTGDIEVCGVTGTATGSQIVGMEGLNTILIRDSELESTITDKSASDPLADGVIIYQSTSGDAEATTGDTATFQVLDSTLTSAIRSGAMFYFTNTAASVVLQNTAVEFDADGADLIRVAGNSANNWGNPGSNGAQVTFTCRDEALEGTVTADTISSLDLFLLDGSEWHGIGVIETNDTASTVAEPLTVNIDGSSRWVVTGDCTVSALNIEPGGAVVDPDGNEVPICYDRDMMFTGSSPYTVTCTGTCQQEITTSEVNELTENVLDRSAFDEYFGVDTAWTMEA